MTKKAVCIWMTGISGAGKTTIATHLKKYIHEQRNISPYILDGDIIRKGLCSDLNFDNSDRIENNRRIAEVSKILINAGITTIVAFISPLEKSRQFARSLFDEGDFFEIFIDTPFEVAEARDVKGLYKAARAGRIPNFTGISSPYEPPQHAECRIDTTTCLPHEAAKLIYDVIYKK